MSRPPQDRGEAIVSTKYDNPVASVVFSVGFFGLFLLVGAFSNALLPCIIFGAVIALILLWGNTRSRLSVGQDWLWVRLPARNLWVDTAQLTSIRTRPTPAGSGKVRIDDASGRYVLYYCESFFDPTIATTLYPMLAPYRRQPASAFDHHFLDLIAHAAGAVGPHPACPACPRTLPPPGRGPAVAEGTANVAGAVLGVSVLYLAAAAMFGAILRHLVIALIAGAIFAALWIGCSLWANKKPRLSVGLDWAGTTIAKTTRWVDLTQLTRLAVRRTRLGTLTLYLDDNAGRRLYFPIRPCLKPAVAAALYPPLAPYRHASPHAFDQPFLARLAEAAAKTDAPPKSSPHEWATP